MRPIRIVLFAVLSALIGSAIAYVVAIRPRIRAWGLDPRETDLPLPGDDLVKDPSAVETRGISIRAPIAKVWPWLVQMGYERAGWYSYDALDNKHPSAERIQPELQSVNVGDVMPTHPGGGFAIKTVDHERALVLYTDTELMRSQSERARAEGNTDLPTPGLKLTGGVLAASYPEFAASWAFYLEPIGSDETRLIERFRVKTPGSGPASAVMGEVMGTGVVLMTRKQMLGIKERAERAEQDEVPAAVDLPLATEPVLEPVS